ncbi:hypothetical protein HUJ04_004543 [Dendroctonus ponderosae]|nr:hypothetical protein HUJ04_004543 [Dendroctonus ponderosae]
MHGRSFPQSNCKKKNVVYNLTFSELGEQQRLIWYSNEHDAKMCVMKGKDEENCQNYIRVMAKTAQSRLLLCGTNAFKPICREYNVLSRNYTFEKEKAGQALCPYDPRHNSTAIYVDGDLYTGTVADFSGMDPIIYREPLQTEQYDSMSLNAPDFVGSMTQGDFVYFFFRETAVEYINCGKAVYSRVARVCKNDRGGPHRFRNRWTSFLKSRLNCSVTGEFPFYFNEIQSTTELIDGKYGDVSAQLIYGTFTTPPNSISGSAVCAFSLQEITDTFEGNFKEQAAINTNWLPVISNKVPDPRPGQCHNDSRTLPDLTLNFIKTHSLMDESGPGKWGEESYFFQSVASGEHIACPPLKSKDAGYVGGLSSNQPKFNEHMPNKDQPDGQIINIIQEKPYENIGPSVTATDALPNQYSVETLITAVVAGAVSALVVGFIAGYLCGRKCHKDEDDNLPYPDTEYEYFEQRQNMNSRITAEPKLLPQEEVTYAEPVLVPQPPPKNYSPKSTLRKGPHQNNAETLFQFQDGGYNGRDNYRGRDNFGTLRSHQGDNFRRPDGFATTRSVKKVYL